MVEFRYPSYVEDIMGPICFDYGFGPFRWVCTSCDPEDLKRSDAIAARVIGEQAESAPPEILQQMLDNKLWIEQAGAHEMVVGSQARILYADHVGRRKIAAAFNERSRRAPSPRPSSWGVTTTMSAARTRPGARHRTFGMARRFTADMAVHNFVGDAMRGPPGSRCTTAAALAGVA